MTTAWQAYRTRRALQRCDSVGRDVRVTGRLVVQNLGRIMIGDGVEVRSEPATSHFVTGPAGTLQIDAGVVLGHGLAVAAHDSITIGAGAIIGPFAMLMDTDFHEAGQHDAAGSTGAIRIGAGARLGARVTVLRGSTIGERAVVAAGSVVKGDVPNDAHVAGNPARLVSAAHGSALARDIGIDAVRDVVAYTFGLESPPPADATRDTIVQWDSLGMLNLLLSLEEAFDVSLSSEAMLRVTCVADLVPVLEASASA